MPDASRLGQAGLKGWRQKIGDRAAPTIAQRTPLKEDQARALIGVVFFSLAALYVAKTVTTVVKELRQG